MKLEYKKFLNALDISITELATLRGISRQYATRDMGNFISDSVELKKFAKVLKVIDTERSDKILRALVSYQSNAGISSSDNSNELDPWDIYLKIVKLKKIETLIQS